MAQVINLFEKQSGKALDYVAASLGYQRYPGSSDKEVIAFLKDHVSKINTSIHYRQQNEKLQNDLSNQQIEKE